MGIHATRPRRDLRRKSGSLLLRMFKLRMLACMSVRSAARQNSSSTFCYTSTVSWFLDSLLINVEDKKSSDLGETWLLGIESLHQFHIKVKSSKRNCVGLFLTDSIRFSFNNISCNAHLTKL